MSSFYTGTGFSIELENFQLELRGKHKGLPLYEVIGGQVTAIAIVEEPAIGIGTIANDASKVISGPVMIPDLKIFRLNGPNGSEECYWYFSADSIKLLQKSFKGKIKLGH
jgi:hypothetical protein